MEYLVITNLATTAALTTVENKIPNVSNLVKKNYNTKINETEQSINDHDKLTVENFTARLKQAKLARKSDIAYFVKNLIN